MMPSPPPRTFAMVHARRTVWRATVQCDGGSEGGSTVKRCGIAASASERMGGASVRRGVHVCLFEALDAGSLARWHMGSSISIWLRSLSGRPAKALVVLSNRQACPARTRSRLPPSGSTGVQAPALPARVPATFPSPSDGRRCGRRRRRLRRRRRRQDCA
jgi:hypothetical protein